MTKKVDISLKSILTLVFLILGLVVLHQVVDIILTLFLSLVLVTALDPLVDKLERQKISRTLAILIIYFLIISIISLLVAAIAPPLIDQTRKLITVLPSSISQIDLLSSNQEAITVQLLSQLGAVPESLLHLVVGIFTNFFAVLTLLVITYYLLLEKKNLGRHLSEVFGPKAQRIASIINNIETPLGSWIRGELFLMSCIGIATYLGLLLLGIDSALPLAIVAGVLEIFPNIGPFISAIPAVLIALTISPIVAVGVIVLYVLIQFCENHFLVPRVMQRAVGINPVIVIICFMIGNRLAGLTGAIIAIPFFVAARVIVKDYLLNRKP